MGLRCFFLALFNKSRLYIVPVPCDPCPVEHLAEPEAGFSGGGSMPPYGIVTLKVAVWPDEGVVLVNPVSQL